MEIENFEVEEQFLGFSPVNFVDSGRCCLLRGYNVALFHCLPHHQLRFQIFNNNFNNRSFFSCVLNTALGAAVINAVNDYCYDGSEEMVSLLQRENEAVDPTVLRQDVEKFLNFTQDAVDKYLDKFELYCLTNVFRVPAHAKLAGDLPLEAEIPSKKDVAALTEELADLKRSLPKLKSKQGELKEELVQLDAELEKAGAKQMWLDAAKLTRKKVRADAEHVQFLAESVLTFGTLGQQVYEATKRNASLSFEEEDETRAYKKRRKATKIGGSTSGLY